MYVSALGYYELSINGQKVGDRVLDPAPTAYDSDKPIKAGAGVLYATFDVTNALHAGKNVLAVMLGNGWACVELRDARPWSAGSYMPNIT